MYKGLLRWYVRRGQRVVQNGEACVFFCTQLQASLQFPTSSPLSCLIGFKKSRVRHTVCVLSPGLVMNCYRYSYVHNNINFQDDEDAEKIHPSIALLGIVTLHYVRHTQLQDIPLWGGCDPATFHLDGVHGSKRAPPPPPHRPRRPRRPGCFP